MKKAVTFRFDPALLDDARRCAELENRTLTNFIETLVKVHVAAQVPVISRSPDVSVHTVPAQATT